MGGFTKGLGGGGVEVPFGVCTADGRATGFPVFGSIKSKALLALDGREKVVWGCWSMMFLCHEYLQYQLSRRRDGVEWSGEGAT